MTAGQFFATVGMGILTVLLPLLLFVGAVAILVYLARRWKDRRER